MDWHLECSGCGTTESPEGLKSVCPGCGRPYLVRYPDRDHGVLERAEVRRRWGMWRYRSFLPLTGEEQPVSLGEGDTPLLAVPRLASALNLGNLWVKDESTNPTGSFKARGLSAAVTRAVHAGATRFTLPTAGNAGVAASAYGARAGCPVRVYAPGSTPSIIQQQIRAFGGDLQLVDGHIGDCGMLSRTYAAEHGAVDLSTLREPYRIEGKKTLGLEIAMQLNWELPEAIIYPTGGGTGLIGMWKAFQELREAGWVVGTLPRMYAVQAEGCAPIVRAWEAGAETATPWAHPVTAAAGLRVPGALGDALILRALRESGGAALAVGEQALLDVARVATAQEGMDWSPEGGATIMAALELSRRGLIGAGERVVLFNTGAGWLYREPGEVSVHIDPRSFAR
ncbi:MAG TPA: threonine synthase [Gemmatimonadales bacterium]|nr:threonine synthase [Gemmatimonadales bacterium]